MPGYRYSDINKDIENLKTWIEIKNLCWKLIVHVPKPVEIRNIWRALSADLT